MLSIISDAFSSLLTMLHRFVIALFDNGSLKLLAPAVGIAVAVSLVFVSVKLLKKVIKGY